jgi:hypothetical protein
MVILVAVELAFMYTVYTNNEKPVEVENNWPARLRRLRRPASFICCTLRCGESVARARSVLAASLPSLLFLFFVVFATFPQKSLC